jgi:hypothetical protein
MRSAARAPHVRPAAEVHASAGEMRSPSAEVRSAAAEMRGAAAEVSASAGEIRSAPCKLRGGGEVRSAAAEAGASTREIRRSSEVRGASPEWLACPSEMRASARQMRVARHVRRAPKMRGGPGEATSAAEMHAFGGAPGREVRIRRRPAHRRRIAGDIRMPSRAMLGEVLMLRRISGEIRMLWLRSVSEVWAPRRTLRPFAGKTRPFMSAALGSRMAGRPNLAGPWRPVASSGVGRKRARGRSGPCGRSDMGAVELVRPLDRRDRRLAMVLAISQGSDPARFPLMLELLGRWSQVMRVRCRELRGGRVDGRSALAAVVADAGRRRGGWNRRVENGGDMRVPEIVHGPVVVEMAVAPVAAVIALAGIAEAIVDAAVIADGRGPVARIEDVIIVRIVPAPVTGGPQQIGSRRHRPVAGHPIILLAVPRPVAGDPDESDARNRRLRIDRNWRRRDRSGNDDVRLRMSRGDERKIAVRGGAQDESCRGGAEEKTHWA